MKIGNSIIAVLALLFVSHCAYALDPSKPFSSYIRTRFNAGDKGLADNIVKGIVQSQDGFLWMILGSGDIVRYDGQSFSFLPVINSAFAMAIGPDNDLWVVTSTELIQIPATALKQIGPLQANRYPLGPNTRPSIIHFDRRGILWAGSGNGLYRFEHGVLTSVTPPLGITRIEESGNGNLLLTTLQGFKEWDGSRVIDHPELTAQLGVEADEIHHVLEDNRGTRWFSTTKGVARVTGNSIEKLQPWGPTGESAIRLYEDPQGNVWVGGRQGLFRATTDRLEHVATDMNVQYMYGDRDGSLWLGTNGNGVFHFTDRRVQMFTTADGLAGNVTMAVLARRDGTLWTGFNCGGLSRFDGSSFRTYNEKDGLLNSCVFALAEDANQDLWIGTYGGGLFRFRNGVFTQFSKPQGLGSDVVICIVPARDGSLWLVTNAGATRLHNGQVRNYTTADGLSNNQLFKIYEDRDGRIWAGTIKGLDRLEGDRFVKVAGVPDVATIPVGEDRSGALYVTLHSRGLYRLENGQLVELLAGPDQTHVVQTEQGDLWLNGGNLMRISGNLAKPRHDEPLDIVLWDVGDGLASLQGSSGYPSSALTQDGKLWMATIAGLAMIDLPHLPKSDRKPEIYMKEFTVGRNSQLPGEQLVLPAGTSHVELRFDAIEITFPINVHLQYRLDGVDSEWLDVEPPGRAVYSTIPPGTHAFHIRACNRDGIWDRTGTVYLIIQKPFFYQTIWFRVAMVATILLLVVGLYRLRLRQATARLNARFDERLAERTRIARELHDTLLQTVQGSKLVADDALEKSDDVVHLRGAMKRLSGWLGQATQEGRAALNSLRTSTIETNDLAAGLRRATEECVLTNTIDVKFSVTGGPRDMHPIARDEIYRIGYEAIRNACEHSSASKLEVSLNYAQDLTLRVKDNGIGIEPAVLTAGKSGHFGLQGMRERAERIGSKLTLDSSPKSGTEMTLVVPGGVIFHKPTD